MSQEIKEFFEKFKNDAAKMKEQVPEAAEWSKVLSGPDGRWGKFIHIYILLQITTNSL